MSESWLFGYQAPLTASTYVSSRTFLNAMDDLVAQSKVDTGAANQHWTAWGGRSGRRKERLLLFPETTSYWLLYSVAGVDPTKYSSSAAAGMATAAALLQDPPANARWLPQLQEALDRLQSAEQVQQSKSQATEVQRQVGLWYERMNRAMLGCVSGPLLDAVLEAGRDLAREHEAWVVLGSLYATAFEPDGRGGWQFRNDYSVEAMFSDLKSQGRPEARDFNLPRIYSQAPVFSPEGDLVAVFPKCFPTQDEYFLGVEGVSPREWNSFETPFGRLGVLICADSWYPAPYRRAANQEVQILLVPSMGMDRNSWYQPWGGFSNFQGFVPLYDRAAEQELVKVCQVLKTPAPITEEGAWTCFALASRMVDLVPTARAGLDVFACGDLFEWNLGGRSVAVWTDRPTWRARMSQSRVTATIQDPAFLSMKLLDGVVCSPADIYVNPPVPL